MPGTVRSAAVTPGPPRPVSIVRCRPAATRTAAPTVATATTAADTRIGTLTNRRVRTVRYACVITSTTTASSAPVTSPSVDVRLSPVRQIAPDVTVVRREDATGRRLQRAPLLVVEVLSPSTRTVDLVLKRRVLEEAGVPSYWLVDPDDGVVTVLELADGGYREVARGDDVTVERPFPVRVRLPP